MPPDVRQGSALPAAYIRRHSRCARVVVMNYTDTAINDDDVPVASSRIFQHLVRTYASEVNKLNSVWHEFAADDLAFKPHPRSSSVKEIIEHELLSERRFFGEFLGLPEVPANEVLPQERTPPAYAARKVRSEEHTSELQSRFGISYAV